IDSPQIALVAFPGAVPKLSIDPGNSGDVAVGLDRAKNSTCLGIKLMHLPVPMLPHPKCPLGPCEARGIAGRRDCRQHATGGRIDFLDAILGDLKQVLTIESRSCMRGNINRTQRLAARRVDRVQLISASKPDLLTVKRDSAHVFNTRKGSILLKN